MTDTTNTTDTIETGDTVVCEGRDGFWTVEQVAKGWFTLSQDDEQMKARRKSLELVPDVEDEEEAAEDTLAKQMRKFRHRYFTSRTHDGKRSMNNGDELAQVLSALSPEQVATLAERVLDLENGSLVQKYSDLNPGQIRMNSGNRIRAALRRGSITLDDIEACNQW